VPVHERPQPPGRIVVRGDRGPAALEQLLPALIPTAAATSRIDVP